MHFSSFAFFNAIILILFFINSSRALPVAPEIANTDIDAPRPDQHSAAHEKKSSSLKKRWYGGLGISMYGGWGMPYGYGGYGYGYGGYGYGGYGYPCYGGYPYYGGYGYGYPYYGFW
jgi:hypothetical protein